jgi:DNA-binding CsgD family transcriptional regulator
VFRYLFKSKLHNVTVITIELTPKEIEMLQGLSEGKILKEIGNISTVKNQMMLLRSKLNARTNAHAVAIAVRRKIIS